MTNELARDTSKYINESSGFKNDLFNIDNDYNNNTFTRRDYDENDEERRDYDDNNDSIIVNIYRYKFTDEFTNEMYKFSKIHQYDHRKDFKEAWNVWTEDNNIIVTDEVKRMDNLGYTGDTLDKMFKSARYYFRKKSTEKNEPQQRRNYVGTQKEILDAMDDHIMKNIKKDDYKPSTAFHNFCEENLKLLQEEVTRLCKCGITDKNEIKCKVKKTYKNRYFMIAKRQLC